MVTIPYDTILNAYFCYQDSDPNAEAFRIIDPQGTGFVDMSVIKKLLLQMPGIDSVRNVFQFLQ